MKRSLWSLIIAVSQCITPLFSCETIEIAPFKTEKTSSGDALFWLVRSQDSDIWYTKDSIPIDDWLYGNWTTVELCGDSIISQQSDRSFIVGIHDIYVDESSLGGDVIQVEINLSKQRILLSKNDFYQELPISVIDDSTLDISTASEAAFNVERYLGIHKIERYRRGIVLIGNENDSIFLRKID